jgi:uncharacterized protein YciI
MGKNTQFMDALFEAGRVILGGPFSYRTGSLVIVTAENAARVHDDFRADPWAEQDLLVVAEVKGWMILLEGQERE